MTIGILLSTLLPLAFAAGVYFGIQHTKAHYDRRAVHLVKSESSVEKE